MPHKDPVVRAAYLAANRERIAARQKEYDKVYRVANRERIAAQQKEYHQKYYVENRERILEQTKQYAAEHPEVRRAAEVRYRARHPEKVKMQNDRYYLENYARLAANKKKYATENRAVLLARYRASNAIRTGKLTPLPCWECGKEEVEAHHANYDAPLDVVWLCHSHHMQLHKGV